MNERVLRGAVIAVFVVCALLVVRLVLSLADAESDSTAYRVPEPRSGEVRVEQAINIASTQPLTVRGYVFNDGDRGLRLCDRLEPGDPPKCVGPYISLDDPDTGRFALETGTDAQGFPVAWVDDPVAIRGHVNGTVMSVEQILR